MSPNKFQFNSRYCFGDVILLMFAKVPIYSFPVNYALTLYGLMNSSFLFDAISLGWSILYIEVIIPKYNNFFL